MLCNPLAMHLSVSFFRPPHPTPQVACGQHHTLFLRRDGVVYGCGSCKLGQLPGNVSRFSPDRTVAIPIKMHLPFGGAAAGSGSGSKLGPAGSANTSRDGGRDSHSGGGNGKGGGSGGGGGGGSGAGALEAVSSAGASGGAAAVAVAAAAAAAAASRAARSPVVHLVVAGGNSSVFVTRGPDEIPEVYSINLLEK